MADRTLAALLNALRDVPSEALPTQVTKHHHRCWIKAGCPGVLAPGADTRIKTAISVVRVTGGPLSGITRAVDREFGNT